MSQAHPTLMPQQWAKPSLEANIDKLLSGIEQGLTVQLISTPRSQLQTCSPTDTVADLLADKSKSRFDFLPVLAASKDDDNFVGLIHLTRVRAENPSVAQPVASCMLPLSEANLIGADAGILSYLRTADKRPCCLVVGGTGVKGIVTLSDLQRLPVRPVVFMLITHLELLMADVIRSEQEGAEHWLNRLSPRRRDMVIRRIQQQRALGNEIDEVTMTQFCDKREILRHGPDPLFANDIFAEAMIKAESLRNKIAHSNDYADTPNGARDTCGTIRLIEKWICRLRKALSSPRVDR